MNLLKRCTAVLSLASLLFHAPFYASAAVGGLSVTAPLKNEVAVEDIDVQKEALRKPNVLFLIESTAAMASTPKGVLPQVWRDTRWDDSYWESGDWELTKNKFGYTIYDINRMMADFTFGMGALPTAWRGMDIRPERNLYGRERDESNNFKKGRNISEDIELNRNNYYFPFLERGDALAGVYSGQTSPLEVGFTNAPELWPDSVQYGRYQALSVVCSVLHATGRWNNLKIGYKTQKPSVAANGAVSWAANPTWIDPRTNKPVDAGMRFEGDEQVAYYDYKGATAAVRPYPYALVFKNPKYWASGWTGAGNPTSADLVPNDSRMYQTKLVLWNMLNNKDLFKNIRFGMATTFLSPANVELGSIQSTHYGYDTPRQDINGIFKVAPFASNVRTKSYFDSGGDVYPKGEGGKKWSHDNPTKDKVPGGYTRVRYENGAMYGPTTGELETFFTIHGQYYPVWHNATTHSNYTTLNSDNTEPDGWWSGWDGRNGNSGKLQGEKSDRPQFKLMNRASLHLPILEYDHVWQKGGKTITHADKFRMWINGLADIKSAGTTKTAYDAKSANRAALGNTAYDRIDQFHYYNDPEIGVAGVFALPQAIFPDPRPRDSVTGKELNLSREYYRSKGWIWYSMRDYDINYRADFRRYSDELEITGAPRARYNAGSGEAAGSVLDFFSPIIDYSIAPPVTTDSEGESYGDGSRTVQVYHSNTKANRAAVDISDLAEASFPIKSTCEDNWLIVIASGAEPRIADKSVYSYSAWEAVKNLYDSTDAARSKDVRLPTGPRKAPYKQVTMMTKKAFGGIALKSTDLDNPIRTLVIGIVASENDPDVRNNAHVLSEVRRMRLNLIRMAVAGQGGDASTVDYGNMYNAPYQPFFADNVASLQVAVQNALTSVGSAQQPQQAKGSVTKVKYGTGANDNAYLSGTYQAVHNNQWEGTLKRYVPVISNDVIVKMDAAGSWELGEKRKRKRDAGGLDVMYWDALAGKFKKLTQAEATARNIFGLANNLIVFDDNGRLPYNEALYQWVRGYDYSYIKNALYPRAKLLADFSLHSIALVDKPNTSGGSLPGYHAWSAAEALKGNPAVFYIQTNDGILHVVDTESGDEKKTILLPPVLLPNRLATLKTTPGANGKLSWIDVTAPDGADGARRSVSGFTLDGPIKMRRFKDVSTGSGWGTYLIGTLGRGGGGLYMLDVSDHDEPKMMWYHEKYENDLISMPPGASYPSHTNSPGVDYAGYMKLGYNSPAPTMGVVREPGVAPDGNPNMRNIIVLAGGAQTNLAPIENGGEGATLLVLDPYDGSVARAFDGDSVDRNFRVGGSVKGIAPYMGMMVSEPTLYQATNDGLAYSSYLTGRIYAADNRGNIFAVLLEGTGAGGHTTHLYPNQWEIKTVATLQRDLASAASFGGNYAIPHGVLLKKDGDSIWIAGGTADILTKKKDEYDPGVIANDKQMIFAFRSSDKRKAPMTRSDLQELQKSSDGAMGSGMDGWYIELDRRFGFDEYVSAKPMLIGGMLLVPTFTTTKYNLANVTDICKATTRVVSGYSRLYALNLRDGSASLWTLPNSKKKTKYIQMDGIKMTGMNRVDNNGKISALVSFDDLGEGKPSDTGQAAARYVEGFNALSVTLPPSPAPINLTSGDSVIYYWLRP
ncbi:MAG: hypothetical protein LBT23_10400 [Synergistaceae bacterium]|jgi:hypothetical protein|nr:hypothetical protein [Synergistaceae bacterium]